LAESVHTALLIFEDDAVGVGSEPQCDDGEVTKIRRVLRNGALAFVSHERIVDPETGGEESAAAVRPTDDAALHEAGLRGVRLVAACNDKWLRQRVCGQDVIWKGYLAYLSANDARK
jgi:hypothetical protein